MHINKNVFILLTERRFLYKIYVCVIIIILILYICAFTIVYGRYILKKVNSKLAESKEFYFNSDVLSEDEPQYKQTDSATCRKTYDNLFLLVDGFVLRHKDFFVALVWYQLVNCDTKIVG